MCNYHTRVKQRHILCIKHDSWQEPMQMLLAKTNMQSKLKFIRLVLRFWAKTRPQSKQYPLFGKHPFVRINAHVIGQFKHAIKTRVKFKFENVLQ